MQGMLSPSLINYLTLPTGPNVLPGQFRNENSCGTKNTLLNCRVAQLLPGATWWKETELRLASTVRVHSPVSALNLEKLAGFLPFDSEKAAFQLGQTPSPTENKMKSIAHKNSLYFFLVPFICWAQRTLRVLTLVTPLSGRRSVCSSLWFYGWGPEIGRERLKNLPRVMQLVSGRAEEKNQVFKLLVYCPLQAKWSGAAAEKVQVRLKDRITH